MACCVLAAFLVAQLVALLRRWGIFWGVVRPQADEDGSRTALRWLRARVARPRVRRALAIAVAFEIGAAGTWLYAAHGSHLYRLADEGVSRLRGERVIYVGYCTPDGGDRYARLVLDRADRT